MRSVGNAELKTAEWQPTACVFMSRASINRNPSPSSAARPAASYRLTGSRCIVPGHDREGADNNVSAGFDRLLQARDVCRTIIGVGEEVESRAIVPDVVGLRWVPFGHIGGHPLYICLIAETSFAAARAASERSRTVT